MPTKQVELADIGKVVLRKRKDSRSVRLSLSHDGLVRVTLPYWVTYQTGLRFVRSKSNWIMAQQQKLKPTYRDGQIIGKSHFLHFVATELGTKIQTQLKNDLALVKIPTNVSKDEALVKKAVRSVSIRALRQEAESILPSRLQKIATGYGFTYKSVSVRSLSGRWGSCNQRGDITLNLFLMQLPWELIDYVLLHELTHTKVLRHGKPFWSEMQRHNNDVKRLRKALLGYRPVL